MKFIITMESLLLVDLGSVVFLLCLISSSRQP